MPFREILVALDGSQYSQNAAEHAFWLANELDASIVGQHVVDPRLVQLFISPQFAEELGFQEAVNTEEKVFRAIKKIGAVVLDLFKKEAEKRNLKVEVHLDVGHIVEELVKRSEHADLVVVGHRGEGNKQSPSNLVLGSVAERVVSLVDCPVLVATQPLAEVDQLLVAYDGSEASVGALLAAEQLAKEAHKPLKAITVAASPDKKSEAEYIVQQGEKFLRECQDHEIFDIRVGAHSQTIIDYATETNSLLVIGAYGHNRSEEMLLGSTAVNVIRRAVTSTLVYKTHRLKKEAGKREQATSLKK